MPTTTLKTLIQVAVLTLASAAAGLGQETIERIGSGSRMPSHIVAIAAATSNLERGRLSGLFVADARGWIYFHSSDSPTRKRVEITELDPKYSFLEPLGMAYSEPNLYVYDGRSRQIWALDMSGEETRRRAQRFNTPFEQPSHLAVSPHGLVAVTDGERLVFLQEGQDPVLYERSSFPEPAGLVFSSWDTLQVLDRARRSLVTITFNRLKGGEIRFLSETESLAEPIDGAHWQTMAVYGGILYLANQRNVFAYLESEQTLIPVLPTHAEFKRLSQLALTDEGLYVVDDGDLEWVPRPQPVDLALDAEAAVSQEALVAFYRYLLELDMLPTRRVRARQSYDRLEDFLLEQEVLIAPTSNDSRPEVNLYRDLQKTAYRKETVPQQQVLIHQREMIQRQALTGAPSWAELICSLNPGFCRDAAPPALEQDQGLTLPALLINRRLGRERIVLEGRPLRTYLDQLVFSREFRQMISPAFLLRLNPRLEEMGKDRVLELSQGWAVVPVEKWAVTAAVPGVEYENRASRLWEFERRFEKVAVYARGGFEAQSARSLLPQPPPDPDPGPPDADCESLAHERQRWLQAIHYSLALNDDPSSWPEIEQKRVRLGVLEFGTTVLKQHQVFSLDPDHATWHSFNLLAELVENPDPLSFEAGEQVVLDMATYSPQAHHGTHVSALIAGRAGSCWSGLLPSARLVLVDLRDSVPRTVAKAIDAETKVLNVSQAFDGPRDDLRQTISGDGRALWVVAAGNSGKDLDVTDEASIPAPARWGFAPNVVAVTAADWDGHILSDLETPEGVRPGANRGKRYVDLVAPGEDIYSATDQKKYGPATGTSQAAPQVAAAAAMLVDRLGERLTPGDAKARLIATADWRDEYEGEVWGGRLNFGAAVRFPDRNILRTTTGAQLGQLHSMEADNDPKIVITNVPRYYERQAVQGRTAPEKILFSRILSLKKRPDGKYRVVLREPGSDHLKILLSAQLEDANPLLGGRTKIECASFEVFDPEEGEFQPDGGCDNGLSITQIEEYVQGGAYQIQWEEQL